MNALFQFHCRYRGTGCKGTNNFQTNNTIMTFLIIILCAAAWLGDALKDGSNVK